MFLNSGKATYKAAIIGCGNIASRYDNFSEGKWTATHAGAYLACPDVDLVSAADVSADARTAFGRRWGVDTLYADYNQMLDRERPDIVSICLPTAHHLNALRAVCDADVKAVFLEKPVAQSSIEARESISIAGTRPVAVNYFRRWNPTLRQLKRELESGIHGSVIRVTVHYVKGLLENASHYIDLLRWFFGDPKEVHLLRVFDNDNEAGGSGADFDVVFERGIYATFLHVPVLEYVLFDADIITDRGRIVIGQRGQKLLRFQAREDPYFRLFQVLELARRPEETQWRNSSLRAVEELVRCLEVGDAPSCSLRDGVRAIEICEAVLSSDIMRKVTPI